MVERIKTKNLMKEHSDADLNNLVQFRLMECITKINKKSDFSAVIYLKGRCSNGNKPAKSGDNSAWMYYIETPDKQYEDHSENNVHGYTQNSMYLEAMIQAMNGALNLEINNNKLLFVTDYIDLAYGITTWCKDWIAENWLTSKGRIVEDIPRWKKIIFGAEDYFPNSKMLCITKGNYKDYPEYQQGLRIVTDFVDSKTQFVK